jgi:hypothetical protein
MSARDEILVLAELYYFLRDARRANRVFMQDLAPGPFRLRVDISPRAGDRSAEILRAMTASFIREDTYLDSPRSTSHLPSMARARRKAITIALDPEADRLLSRAARERGISRSEFIRQQLTLVLEQYRRHPRPTSAGSVRALDEPGDERDLFGGGR